MRLYVPLPRVIRTAALVAGLLASTAAAAAAAPSPNAANQRAWTSDDLFASPTPFALGHRGYGANDGEDPTRPLANTLDAFHRAFTEGIRVVELDLQRTADGKIVVFHDDYLPDFTCVGSLTYGELHARRPHIPLFQAVLNTSRHFGYRDQLSGILFAEIKVPIPLCDGANTSEQAAISEHDLVAAVVADIRQARMERQVILNSGSPSILHQVAVQAPEIKRALTLNALQLLSPAEASAVLGLPVVKIPKNDCGLDWYNIGAIARLPALPGANANQRFGSFLGAALGCAASQAVSLDKLALGGNPAVAQALIGAVHGVGLKAVVWTIENEAEWDFAAGAGADGITTNDIPLGLAKQAALPVAALAGTELGRTAPAAVSPRGLAMYPPRLNPSQDGALRLEFALPDGGPARITVVDVAGRQVATREVGALGAGTHLLSVGRNLPSGLYLVRLTNGREQALIKATVLR
jgi:glycerophosphoryl diester phosphodiesterase